MPDQWLEARDAITGDSWADDLARASLSAAQAKFGAYRVLVTASRTWADRKALHAALDEAEQRGYEAGYRMVVVVNGKARGGDEMADEWALLPSPLPGMERCPERHALTRDDWYPGGRFDPSAGMKRNSRMVESGADEALAFIDECAKTTCKRRKPHGSHGASHAADLAERSGINTRRYAP